MSKFDYINEELAKFREEGKKEWQIRQSARMLGDKRNEGKVRTPEVREKLATLKKGNKNRKGNQKDGEILIELISKEVGLWLNLKQKLNITTNLSTKAVTRNRRLFKFHNDGSYSVLTYPDINGFCFMPYKEYLSHKKRYKEEPSPFYEGVLIKEVKSGIVGCITEIKKHFPKFSHFHLDKKYNTNSLNNPWKNNETFITVSKQIAPYKNIYIPNTSSPLIKTISRIRPKGRAISQLDNEGNEINRWNKIKDAAKETGISAGSIQNVAAGRAKKAGGYKFKYI